MLLEKPDWLQAVRLNNHYDLSKFVAWSCNGDCYGWVRRDRVETVLSLSEGLFRATDSGLIVQEKDAQKRQEGFDRLAQNLAKAGCINPLRKERYKISKSWAQTALATIDRVAAPYLGIRAFGVHICGYVRKDSGLFVWIGRRALDRFIDPGKLDTMVGGGQPADLSIRENMQKEAFEEAGLEGKITDKAIAVGAVSYVREDDLGLKPDTMFLYDLELPEHIIPQNTDGEVEGFELMPVEQVAALVLEGTHFKKNCNLALTDFFIRHGVISPEDPTYLDLLKGLHQTL